ncbi:hypothetical protein [Microtetraspora niveoalba]|uniref:hypothetical protein n=1 Tax=Microtetraspora niveoalba TaxID=46175 RepID=UPI0014720048|nr:hypothetical protein [Microtetraspora niveoalba]
MRLVRTPILGISSRTGGEADIAFAAVGAGSAAGDDAAGVAALGGGAGGSGWSAPEENASANAAADVVTRAKAMIPPAIRRRITMHRHS